MQERNKQQALRYLTVRMRSEKEVRDYMLKKHVTFNLSILMDGMSYVEHIIEQIMIYQDIWKLQNKIY